MTTKIKEQDMILIYKHNIYIIEFPVVFAVIYSVNLTLPVGKTFFIHFKTLTERAWRWSDILISSIAIFYVLKIKKITKIDLVISIVLGLLVELADYVAVVANKNNLGLPIPAISTVMCYYSACQIFSNIKKKCTF